MDIMQIMGHRGAAGTAPENTLEGIQKALDIGVDWVEFDVRATVDGRLVVIHSPSTRKIAEQRLRVKKSTLSHLQRVHTRSRAIIPTLPEVVQLISNRAKINIELKSSGCAKEVVKAIKRLRNAGYTYDHFLVSSFRVKLLLEIQELDPKIPLGLLHYSVPLRFIAYKKRGLKLKAVGFNHNFVTARFIKLAKAMGLFVYIYTVNSKSAVKKYEEWGADAIVTDHPEYYITGKHRTKSY